MEEADWLEAEGSPKEAYCSLTKAEGSTQEAVSFPVVEAKSYLQSQQLHEVMRRSQIELRVKNSGREGNASKCTHQVAEAGI